MQIQFTYLNMNFMKHIELLVSFFFPWKKFTMQYMPLIKYKYIRFNSFIFKPTQGQNHTHMVKNTQTAHLILGARGA